LYADLWKLARRGTVYSTTTTWMFRLAPVAILAATVVAAALLPLDGRESLLRFTGDAVAFASLLALGRFLLVLAALDTGSSFEGMGASRDVAFGALLEPGLFIALGALGIAAGDSSLSAMLAGPPRVAGAGAAMVMVAVSLFALTLAECSRVPVDDPTTHLELAMVHEVMVLDHSGPDLAMILYAGALKLGVFAGITLHVVLPGPHMAGGMALLPLPAALVGLGLGIGVVESVMARLRLPRVPLYLAASSAMGLFGLLLLLR
jgi:formate hydrogenlyase subunit 4